MDTFDKYNVCPLSMTFSVCTCDCHKGIHAHYWVSVIVSGENLLKYLLLLLNNYMPLTSFFSIMLKKLQRMSVEFSSTTEKKGQVLECPSVAKVDTAVT